MSSQPPCPYHAVVDSPLAVYRFLEERGALQMLEDPLMHVATAEVVAGERDR